MAELITGWNSDTDQLTQGIAIKTINFLNKVGNNIEKIFATYEKVDTYPFWKEIKDKTLEDGREAKQVIIKRSGHLDHFHIRGLKK